MIFWASFSFTLCWRVYFNMYNVQCIWYEYIWYLCIICIQAPNVQCSVFTQRQRQLNDDDETKQTKERPQTIDSFHSIFLSFLYIPDSSKIQNQIETGMYVVCIKWFFEYLSHSIFLSRFHINLRVCSGRCMRLY